MRDTVRLEPNDSSPSDSRARRSGGERRPGRAIVQAGDVVRSFAPDGQVGQGAPHLRWTEAWSGAGGRGVVVGLLDSGVDTTVPDLGALDLVVRDFTGDSTDHRVSNPRSLEHGTHSATLLAGQGRLAMRGLAPLVRLRIASVVGASGVATPSTVAVGIDWLTSAGARVIAIPLGDCVDRDEISRAIEHATAAGVSVFAAAGNGHPEPIAFPARHPFVISVGAADDDGVLLQECSRSPRLDLIAPGRSIPGLVRRAVIRRRRGTSVACVIAAGVAALALSARAVPVHGIHRSNLLTAISGGARPE